MASDGTDGGWGISHLSSMPITLTFGVVLALALLMLIFLRVAFGEIRVGVK